MLFVPYETVLNNEPLLCPPFATSTPVEGPLLMWTLHKKNTLYENVPPWPTPAFAICPPQNLTHLNPILSCGIERVNKHSRIVVVVFDIILDFVA